MLQGQELGQWSPSARDLHLHRRMQKHMYVSSVAQFSNNFDHLSSALQSEKQTGIPFPESKETN
jgi:hypothetical protein